MRFRITHIAAIAMALMCNSVSVSAADMREFPSAVICNVGNGTQVIGYLSRVRKDGTAIYRAGDIVAVIDADGIVEHSHLRQEGDCAGKSVEELRAAGQTVEFAK